MNLLSGLEEERYVFYGMTAAAILLAVVTARWGRLALKRARSVKGKQDGFARHSIPFFIGHLGRSSEQESAV